MNRTFPALAAAALMASGCAYLGPPLPPLANVPGHITDLAAIQRDARVIRFKKQAAVRHYGSV